MSDFARFDRRRYPTVSVRAGYGRWTPTYEDTVEDTMDLALLERLERIRWDEVRRAADLGCGTGRTGTWLAARGVARIDGVDLTPEMLALARSKGIYERLVEGDVGTPHLAPREYDLVVSCLVEEHLRGLEPLYREARRLLRDDGWFVLVGYHPFFMMSAGMPTHFDDAEEGPVAIETHIHLFEEHVAAARVAGLVLAEMHERVIDDEWIALKPKWEERRDWPVSYALALRVGTS